MPALTRFYGVLPWEWEQFTLDEISEYVRWHDDYLKAQRKAAQAARR